jgi:hypothetical protein
MDIAPSFNLVSKNCFDKLLEQFKTLIQEDDISFYSLYDLVTTLRYNVMVCTPKDTQILNDIAQNFWFFLERNNYAVEMGFLLT